MQPSTASSPGTSSSITLQGIQSILSVIRRESRLLSTVLCSSRRSRVYRHHAFYHLACRATATSTRVAQGKSASLLLKLAGGEDTATPSAAIEKLEELHRIVQAAAEAASKELAASRIDTVPLTMVLISGLARVGCCVDRLVLCKRGLERCRLKWGTKYVNSLLQMYGGERSAQLVAAAAGLTCDKKGVKRPREEAGLHGDLLPVDLDSQATFGDVVDAILKKRQRVREFEE